MAELINTVSRTWENAEVNEFGRVVPGKSTIKVVANNYNRSNGYGFCEETITQDGHEISFDDSLTYVSGYNDPYTGYEGYPNGYGFRLL